MRSFLAGVRNTVYGQPVIILFRVEHLNLDRHRCGCIYRDPALVPVVVRTRMPRARHAAIRIHLAGALLHSPHSSIEVHLRSARCLDAASQHAMDPIQAIAHTRVDARELSMTAALAPRGDAGHNVAACTLTKKRPSTVALAGVGDAVGGQPRSAEHVARDAGGVVAGVVFLANLGAQSGDPCLLQHAGHGARLLQQAEACDGAASACSGLAWFVGQARRCQAVVEGHGLVQAQQRKVHVVGRKYVEGWVAQHLRNPTLHCGCWL
mmetsp:Transcript_94406/g.224865  ORF Transcript_94406/g.224865 Transcript_94406/m.224865 type:complete len:265 (+) Transcript_94406:265-1059(+)